MAIDIQKIKKRSTDQKVDSLKGKTDGSTNWLNRDLPFSKTLSDKKKSRFYSELSILLKSGIDIKTALEIAIEGKGNKRELALINQIKTTVINGESLSEAIKESKLFSDYEYFSLKIGEESGNVIVVLKDLAQYFGKKIEQRRKIISTFSYPIIVMLVAIVAVVFMLNFIVPMFRDVFSRFGGDLPGLTQFILEISDELAANGIYFLVIILLVIILVFSQRNKLWFRKLTATLILKIPFLNELVKKVYLARFSHSMHLLIQAKNPLLNSIQLAKKIVGFYPLENALDQIEKDVLYGSPLYESMEKHAIFNRKITSLVKVGEEVNQLELIFNQINEQYVEEIEHQTEVVGNMMEPLLIIFIGGFVAVILVAMYLPLFQLGSSAF